MNEKAKWQERQPADELVKSDSFFNCTHFESENNQGWRRFRFTLTRDQQRGFPITVSQPPPLPSPSLLIVNRLWNNCCAFKNKFIHTKMYANFVSPELHKNTNYVLFSYAGFLVLSTLSIGVGAISNWGRRYNGIKTQNHTKQQWLHFTILINKCTFDEQFEGKSNSQVCQSAISERLFLVWNEYIKFLNLPWDAQIFAATERKKHQSEQPNWHFL